MKEKVRQWLKDIEQKDKVLSKRRRQVKWLSIVGALFTLFILSFFIGNPLSVDHMGIIQNDTLGNQEDSLKLHSPFELPVDSFEQLLNQQIHEDTH